MDATFWTAVGSVGGVVALGLAMMVHVVRYAYQRGVLDQRLAALERAQTDGATATAAISTLNIAVATLDVTVKGLKETLDKRETAISERFDQLDRRLDDSSGRRRLEGAP